jgi:hypothetical protein
MSGGAVEPGLSCLGLLLLSARRELTAEVACAWRRTVGQVRDVLVLVGRPEWPAAHLASEKLGLLFCQRLSSASSNGAVKEAKRGDKDDAASKSVALELLGTLLAALHEHKRKHADAPLLFPGAWLAFDGCPLSPSAPCWRARCSRRGRWVETRLRSAQGERGRRGAAG